MSITRLSSTPCIRPATSSSSASISPGSRKSLILSLAWNRRRAAQSQLAVSRAKVAEARAQVAQSKAAADRAAEDLANATVRAPIRGTVLSRDVEIGSPVSSILNMGANASLVMTLGDIEQVFVRGKVDEADIGRVQLGQTARIRVETFKDKVFMVFVVLSYMFALCFFQLFSTYPVFLKKELMLSEHHIGWIFALAAGASIALFVLLPFLERPALYDHLAIFWIVLAALTFGILVIGYSVGFWR